MYFWTKHGANFQLNRSVMFNFNNIGFKHIALSFFLSNFIENVF